MTVKPVFFCDLAANAVENAFVVVDASRDQRPDRRIGTELEEQLPVALDQRVDAQRTRAIRRRRFR